MDGRFARRQRRPLNTARERDMSHLLLHAGLAAAALALPASSMAQAFRDVLDTPASISATAPRGLVNGLARAGARVVAVGQRGHVLYSDDGGRSWTQAQVPVSSDLELQLLVMSRNFDEAEPLADRKIARQRYPSAGNLGQRAYVRLMNGKYDGAVSDAREALALDPSDTTARNALILALLRLGKFSEAERLATKDLAKDVASAELYYARAIARAELGNAAGASADLQAARQLGFEVFLNPAFVGMKAD